MFNSEQLDELTKKLLAIIPCNVNDAESNIHQKIKGILQSACNRLNLVTREEFDVQTKVLAIFQKVQIKEGYHEPRSN